MDGEPSHLQILVISVGASASLVGAMWTAFLIYIKFLNAKFVAANEKVAQATETVAHAVEELTKRFDGLVMTDHVHRPEFEAERSRLSTLRDIVTRNTVRLETLEGRRDHRDARENDGG
jgi:BMFP domain-containing protein YqiC